MVGPEKFFPNSDFCERKASKGIRHFPQREMTQKVRRDSSHSDNPLTTDRVGFTSRVVLDVYYQACEVELEAREEYNFKNIQVRHSIIKSNRRNFKKQRFM